MRVHLLGLSRRLIVTSPDGGESGGGGIGNSRIWRTLIWAIENTFGLYNLLMVGNCCPPAIS